MNQLLGLIAGLLFVAGGVVQFEKALPRWANCVFSILIYTAAWIFMDMYAGKWP